MSAIRNIIKLACVTSGLIAAGQTAAHVTVTNKIYSNSYTQVEMAVPHGCEGYDTVKVEVTLPEGLVGTLRPLDSLFGTATVEVNEEGVAQKIIWTATKPLYRSDSHSYDIAFRTKTPDATFQTLFFPTIQTCEDSDGNTYTTEWVGTDVGHDNHDSEVKPAPKAVLFPKVSPGWHKFDITDHLHDLSIFNDAEIVWMDKAAYSGNAHTMQMIEEDAEASVLDAIHPGSTIWVKY